MRLTQEEFEVIADLISTDNEAQWNAICERVKCDGKYPDWWRRRVIATGLRQNVEKLLWRAAQRAAK